MADMGEPKDWLAKAFPPAYHLHNMARPVRPGPDAMVPRADCHGFRESDAEALWQTHDRNGMVNQRASELAAYYEQVVSIPIIAKEFQLPQLHKVDERVGTQPGPSLEQVLACSAVQRSAEALEVVSPGMAAVVLGPETAAAHARLLDARAEEKRLDLERHASPHGKAKGHRWRRQSVVAAERAQFEAEANGWTADGMAGGNRRSSGGGAMGSDGERCARMASPQRNGVSHVATFLARISLHKKLFHLRGTATAVPTCSTMPRERMHRGMSSSGATGPQRSRRPRRVRLNFLLHDFCMLPHAAATCTSVHHTLM
jgi:hypothetical protein